MTTQMKQPRSLYMLFFAEMWERFSFYGMRALLLLYLTDQLFAAEGAAEADRIGKGIYAAYGALVYATPFIGGIVADRILGYKRSVLLGGLLMAIGHFVMAIETEFMLYVALAFLIAGNGFFKPNISSMVGGLYESREDPRRDSGFTIFYMGINLGAGAAPLICGYIGETYDWFWGFSIAGIGMLLGLAVFWKWHPLLGDNGEAPDEGVLKKWGAPTYIAGFLSVAVFALLIRYFEVMSYVLTPFALLVIGVIVTYAVRAGGKEGKRLAVVLILLAFTTLFWAFFEQAGSSISLFTKSNVDRTLGDMSVPTSIFQSVNPIFILVLAPLFVGVWASLARRGLEPPAPYKFAMGIALLGIGFLILGWSSGSVEAGEVTFREEGELVTRAAAVVPMMFLVFGYLLHTMGELCLSPIGLSLVTKLSPKKIAAMVMGAWFLSSAMAHHLGGIISLLMSPPAEDAVPGALARASGLVPEGAEMSEAMLRSYDGLANYTTVFEQLGWIACGAAVLCLVLAPLLTKWMFLEEDAAEPEPETF